MKNEEKNLEINGEQETKRSKKKWLIMLLLLFLSMFTVLEVTYTYNDNFKNAVNDMIIDTFHIEKPTAPVIGETKKEWSKKEIVKIKKDAKNYSGVAYYEYCVMDKKEFGDCEWKRTDTKNAVISKTGKNYVVFRGVSNNNKKGTNSNIVEVWIDNNNPKIEKSEYSLEENKLNIKVEASDSESGVEKYLYSINNSEYVEGKDTYSFEGVLFGETYLIKVKVIDKVGNEIEYSESLLVNEKLINKKQVEKKDSEEDKEKEKEGEKEDKEDKKDIENPEKPIPVNPEDPTNPKEPEEEKDEFIPEIDLDLVPSEIGYGESYELPSHYKFGKTGGVVTCLVNGIEVKNTDEISTGSYLIECEAKGNNGKTAKVSKEIKINPIEGMDEVEDGWMILTLYYPKKSTNWQWRIGREGEVRTGYDQTGWQDYTGPIKIRIEDVSNVYIRYDLDGEEVIEAPNGKIVVDIQPIKYSLIGNEKTQVSIYYDKKATTKLYSINGGSLVEYTGPFEVEANTIIEAEAKGEEAIYDATGDKIGTRKLNGTDTAFISEIIEQGEEPGPKVRPKGPVNPIEPGVPIVPVDGIPGPGGKPVGKTPGGTIITTWPETPIVTLLEGPSILSSVESLANETTITITTQELGTIYYSIDGEQYKEYKEPFIVNKNCVIRSYYVRSSDGKVSKTTSKRISNMLNGDKPYLKISANPDPLKNIRLQSSVEVCLYGERYDTIEYSLDGIYYRNYTGCINVTYNTTVYGKATNVNGDTEEVLVLNNLINDKNKLDVEIVAVPESDKDKLIDETLITINYDSRATLKEYKIGNGAWQAYTGPFKVTRNTTVYAHCESIVNNGVGNTSKRIDYLHEGLNDPLIKVDIESPVTTSKVEVEIEYDSNATVKKYRINNGVLEDYTGKIKVEDNNTTIIAYSEDSLGNIATSSRKITNIVKELPKIVLDKGMYYLVKLNYPSTSSQDGREYKWEENDWKKYPKDGLLFIKPEYKHVMIGQNGGLIVKIQDENNQEITFNGDIYILNSLTGKIGNIYMRWDTVPPQAPVIELDTAEWAKEVEVMVKYPKDMIQKLYKINYEDGTSTGWQEYSGKITLNQNGTVYAKCQDDLEVWSSVSSKVVRNIDLKEPNIKTINIIKATTNTIEIMVDGNDKESGIKYYYYSIDGIDYKASQTNNITIKNLEANKEYRIYVKAVDKVGNVSEIRYVNGTTQNISKPVVSITPDIDKWSQSKKITLTHSNSELELYYSLDGIEYTLYTEQIVLEENSMFKGKVTDGTNEVYTETYNIETIDRNKPVVSNLEVVSRSSRLIVNVNGIDNENDIEKYYYSLDGINYIERTENTYTFNNLEKEKEYTVYVKVGDKAENISNPVEKKAKTTDIGEMVYKVIPGNDKWAYTKEVEIDYPYEEDNIYRNQYSLDLGQTWKDYTGNVVIEKEDTTIIARVVDGSKNIKTASSLKVTMIDRTEPTISLDKLPNYVLTTDTYDLPSSYTVDESKSGGSASCSINGVVYTKVEDLPAGKQTIVCTVTTGAGRSASVSKEITVARIEVRNVESLLKGLEDDSLETGYYTFTVDNNGAKVSYPVHLYVLEGNQVFSENMTFGDANDVATGTKEEQMAKNMVIVKVKGDLTINTGVIVGPYYNSSYGGPKGFTIYVTGKLTNNGTIDNSHGAYAYGQDVYLWKNADGTYETVPAVGGAGAPYVNGGAGDGNSGKAGTSGTGRQTGGGGSGSQYSIDNLGAGAAGTSYSGGSGGGGGYYKLTNALANGGTGGTAGEGGGSGAGNPAGSLDNKSCVSGQNGTGGLLVIYANEYQNNGTLSAYGYKGGVQRNPGGSSGGGSINIFTNQPTNINYLGGDTQAKYNSMLGSFNKNGGASAVKSLSGGAGGNGSINIGEIRNGQYYDLKDIIEQDKEAYKNSVTKTGESILSILNQDIPSGYWFFQVNGESYSVHLYVLEGDQVFGSNQVFGDAGDCAIGTTANQMAKNMVIVKVKGDLTINTGVTVRPYYNTTYGGPKGFTIYVTGKLTNNGTIDNSHGAYAKGQNVYLWKNADGTYEYVPAAGGAGANGVSKQHHGVQAPKASGRQTGGGGSGGNNGGSSNTYAGTAGTSYSGGTGSGGSVTNLGAAPIGNGGTGGAGGSNAGSGGTGNPGGKGYSANENGKNGTGGLLVIYANEYQNNGTLSAKGTVGGTGYNSIGASGGSSGGGSINVFYASRTATGTANVSGGVQGTGGKYKGGAGGTGTVTYTQIEMPVSLAMARKTVAMTANPIEILSFIDTPIYEKNNNTIKITYPIGYKNEYSLDLGKTWIEYNNDVLLDSSITIMARCIDKDENIVSSSSVKVTSIVPSTNTNDNSLSNPDINGYMEETNKLDNSIADSNDNQEGGIVNE